ncbi:MAG TPA: C4-type zinc ribbon domain-containing protein [Tichowtungia sp.]|nr:C4-type zinc ribbon domain-containing protein [Tichowtungia sp.]
MAHPLEALLVLQDKDRKIAKLQREIRDIPARKAEVETQLEQAKTKLAEAREAQMKVQSDLKQLEVEVESHKEKMLRYKQQQMEAKTNDQYRALLIEEANEKKGITELEDRELELMEQLETSKKAIEEREAELAEEEDGIRDEQEMLAERLDEVEGDLKALVERRTKLAADVDPALLTRYERILANKGDFAVVRVENGHCRGCNMKLPPQVVNDAINPAKLVGCNYCGRMLINI